ncbi:MAG: DUF481 domain-containing protein, partial [Methylococcales bacterium]|nr:DUF481 domain-containing protein [Methylococcales bacterium]
DANIALRGRDDKVTFGGLYNYSDNTEKDAPKSTLNARNFQVFGTYSHFFNNQWYGYAHGLFTNDRMQNIQLRSAFGAGAGYEFFSSKDLNLSFEAGPDYVSTNMYEYPLNKSAEYIKACKAKTDDCILKDTGGIAARWFVNYDQFILNRAVQLFHNHEGIFDGNMFIRSRTGFHVPVWNGIQFTNEVQVDYYNGYSKLTGNTPVDTRYLFSIGYGW